jgi:hypothetical protein
MNQGQCLLDAKEPAIGIDHYYSLVDLQRQESGTGEAEVKDLSLKVGGQLQFAPEPQICHGAEVSLVLQLNIQPGRTGAQLHIYIMDEAMTPIVCVPVQDPCGGMLCIDPGESRLEVSMGSLELCAGKYSFTIGLTDSETLISLARVQGLLPFRVIADRTHWGKIVRPAKTRLESSRSMI